MRGFLALLLTVFVFAVIPYTLIAPKAVKYMSRNAKQKWFRSKKGLFYPMICVVCVDDKMGMLFNHRRQSQDRALRARLLTLCAHSRLWMNAYSLRQFQKELPLEVRLSVDEDFLTKAGIGEVCFVEGLPLLPWLDRIEQVILYRWNRDYPADTYLDLALDAPPWSLAAREDFPGFSHPMLTKEVYIP